MPAGVVAEETPKNGKAKVEAVTETAVVSEMGDNGNEPTE